MTSQFKFDEYGWTATNIKMYFMRMVAWSVVIQIGDKNRSVVTRTIDKLIQYIDFIKDERLPLYLTDSEKNDAIVKIHLVCQKTITNEMKRKGDTVPTTSKKNWHNDMWQSSAGKLIVCIANRRVFQILNILNVKKSETFVHCLSGRVYWKIVIKEM